MKAFVSSTFLDLKEHRAHVIRSLRKAGIHVDPMEDWTAVSEEPTTFCQERVDGCDLCVLLVARRRGFIPDGEHKSITQIEYDHALNTGIPVLVYMLHDEALWHREYDDLDRDPALVVWRNELLKRHGVEFFQHQPQSIEVAPALSRWISDPFGNTIFEASPYTLRWYVFAPFCPGIGADTSTLPSFFKLLKSTPNEARFSCSEIPDVTLTWFPFGGAVWTLKYEDVFVSLTEFAKKRHVLYRDIANKSHRLCEFTDRIISDIITRHSNVHMLHQSIGYSLSSCFLIRHRWPIKHLRNALQILACPGVLLPNNGLDSNGSIDINNKPQDREMSLLFKGVVGDDINDYSVPNTVQGYACWAGISAYVVENRLAEYEASSVAFEEHLQGLWWRLHSYEAMLDGSPIQAHTYENMKQINRYVHNLLRIGPTDITAVRLFKEAVVRTSRIESVWNNFKSNLNNIVIHT